jgi:hypothetical protein
MAQQQPAWIPSAAANDETATNVTFADTVDDTQSLLPVLSQFMPLVEGVEPPTEDDYVDMLSHLLRAVIQVSPWRHLDPADRVEMVRRTSELFANRTPLLTEATVRAVVKNVKNENSSRLFLTQYVAFMNAQADEYRCAANFASAEFYDAFTAQCHETVRDRLHQINVDMSSDEAARVHTQKVFDDILTGKAMLTEHATDKPADGEADGWADVNGCFGNELVVMVQDVSWRQENFHDTDDAMPFAEAHPPKRIRATLEIHVNGEQRSHELPLHGKATRVFDDPTVSRKRVGALPKTAADEDEAEVNHYWRFDTPEKIGISVGLGVDSAPSMELVVRLLDGKKGFGCTAAATELAEIHINLSSLYTDVMPLGCAERKDAPGAGYHFTWYHHVDRAAGKGFGATLQLQLNCRATEHIAAPYFFNPRETLNTLAQAQTPAPAPAEEPAGVADHHRNLLILFEMCREITDTEYLLLECYCDRYLVHTELFDVAANLSRVKYNDFGDARDRADAVSAMLYLQGVAARGFQTVAAKEQYELSIGEEGPIRQRMVGVLCALEQHARVPSQGENVFTCAVEVLSMCGLSRDAAGEHNIAAVIGRQVDEDIDDALNEMEQRALNMPIVGRTSLMYRLMAREFDLLVRSRGFAAQSKSKQVMAVAVRRADVSLTKLIAPLRAFVVESIRRITSAQASGGDQLDPFGETFCLLSGLYERTISCAEAIREHPLLTAQANELAEVFDPFLVTWVSQCQDRLLMCVENVVMTSGFRRIHHTYVCDAPCNAIHVISEVIEFFVNCAGWAPTSVVTQAVPQFIGLVGTMASEFAEAFSAKGKAEWPAATNVDRWTNEAFTDPMLETLRHKFVCAMSLRQFREMVSDLLDEEIFHEDGIVEAAAAACDDAGGRDGVVAACRSIRQHAFAAVDAACVSAQEHICYEFADRSLRDYAFAPAKRWLTSTRARSVWQPSLIVTHVRAVIDAVLGEVRDSTPAEVHGTYRGDIYKSVADSYCALACEDTPALAGFTLLDDVLEQVEGAVVHDGLQQEPQLEGAANAATHQCRVVRKDARRRTAVLIDALKPVVSQGGTGDKWTTLMIVRRAASGDSEAKDFVHRFKLTA